MPFYNDLNEYLKAVANSVINEAKKRSYPTTFNKFWKRRLRSDLTTDQKMTAIKFVEAINNSTEVPWT